MCMLTFIRMSIIMSLILSVWLSHPDLNIHYEVPSSDPYCSQYDVETYSRSNALGYRLQFSIFNLQPRLDLSNISTVDQVGVTKPLAAIHDAGRCCPILT